MLFNSFDFLWFLPVVFVLYWLTALNLRVQNAVVVIASYVFYGWWDWRFLLLIAFTSAWSYAVGLIELKRWTLSPSKTLLKISLIINLGILGFFKYCDFFIEQTVAMLNVFGFNPHVLSLRILLPVGISFYTFQALSYTIDVYRRQIRPTRDPIAFFAFISFFPQLVAGPIERATNLLPQFLNTKTFDYSAAVLGCRQMLWGFFKKMVVADNCAVIANHLLNLPDQSNGFAVWLGVIFFAVQIYGDFSGYSDIAIGCARLFGINLMRNFSYPYFARDIAEFWRRWHISLTTWFRDYLYIPLGGSRCGLWKKTRNILIIFLVSGFWHGANWTFICWGAFHALLFIPLLLTGSNRKNIGAPESIYGMPAPRAFCGMILTFFLAVIGWTFFRATSIGECMHWFAIMFNLGSWECVSDLPHELGAACGGIAALLAVEWFNRFESFGFSRLPCNVYARWSVYFLVLVLIVFYTPGSQSFIYFQF